MGLEGSKDTPSEMEDLLRWLRNLCGTASSEYLLATGPSFSLLVCRRQFFVGHPAMTASENPNEDEIWICVGDAAAELLPPSREYNEIFKILPQGMWVENRHPLTLHSHLGLDIEVESFGGIPFLPAGEKANRVARMLHSVLLVAFPSGPASGESSEA